MRPGRAQPRTASAFGNPAGFAGAYDFSHAGLRAFQFWCTAWATEALRVLKPGGHLLAFGGTRTYHRLACAVEDAGFEIRDSINWLYGSGFPKSKNLGDGWGTALKPSHEPVVLARKPLAERNVAANVLAHGTGALNIDGTRIEGAVPQVTQGVNSNGAGYRIGKEAQESEPHPAGRWPANLVLTHDPDCSDDCVPGCPVRELDAQSGERPAGSSKSGREPKAAAFSGNLYGDAASEGAAFDGYADAGGASRFFPVFRYEPKAGRAERERGLEHRSRDAILWSSGEQSPGTFQAEGTDRTSTNPHPTVKPVELMRWLCRLITPPGGLVLDPFAGSGSTGIGALREGFDFIGIELDPDYVAIARDRILGDAPLLNAAAEAVLVELAEGVEA